MAEPKQRHLGSRDTKTKGILFAIEDTGYAFEFYKYYLKRNYQDIIGDLLGVGGADSFDKELSKRFDYDKYVIIYDSGAEMQKLNKVRRALTKLRNNTDAPIYVFTPKCFEEILLSFTYLDNYVKDNKNTEAYKIYRDTQEMINGADCVDYFKYDSDIILSEEKRIEQYIEELTNKTVFEYKHTTKRKPAIMSECWIQECCQFDKTKKQYNHLKDKMNKCKGLYTEHTKTKLIAQNSILGVLDNFLSKLMYNKECNNLKKLNPKKKHELWRELSC